MTNAFLPDEKRRHQYLPTEDPPDYNVAPVTVTPGGPSSGSESGPSRSSRLLPTSVRGTNRSQATVLDDELDALSTDDEDAHDGHAGAHRPDSEDSLAREFQDLELEEQPTKEPIHVRISREFQRITARVDRVIDRYVNPTVMRYVYGTILGVLVLALVYIFGGSIPTIDLPNQYAEGALRAYINEELSADNIKKFAHAATERTSPHSVERLFNNKKLAEWIHDEFAGLGVARNALDPYFVYYPAPIVDGQSMTLGDQSIDLYDAENRLKSFVTHGASGNVTGPLVYVNYARPSDLEWLESSGVRVEGSIALLKKSLVSDLASQVRTLSEFGAVACIMYASNDEFGASRGSNFPDGPFMPSSYAINGDVAYTWVQPGDVLTPGWPSGEKVKVQNPSETLALPTIPIMSLCCNDAEMLLKTLLGSGVSLKNSWLTGFNSESSFFTGSGTLNSDKSNEVRIANELRQELKHPIRNVLSEIEGMESDQVLTVGTSMASPSNIGVLLEVSRIFADLVTKYKWRPRRSIIFAAWDSTSENFMGSTEWGESQVKSLRRQGIAYLNIDNVASLASNLSISATPSLTNAILSAMSYVDNKDNNGTLADGFDTDSIRRPSSFSDSLVFGSHIGSAVADVGLPVSALSPECLNSVDCIADYIDPHFSQHAVMAKFYAMIILEIADEKFIPLDVHRLARDIEAGVQELAVKYPALNFGGDLYKVFQELDSRTDVAMQFLNEWSQAYQDNKKVESQAMNLKRANWNYAVAQFHRNLHRSIGWTTWFENPIYGPSQTLDKDGQRGWLFPHIEDHIAAGNPDRAQGAVQMLGDTLLAASQALTF